MGLRRQFRWVRPRTPLFALLFIVSLPISLRAQAMSQLRGRITTIESGAIFGARVQVTPDSGVTRETKTDSAGWYHVEVPGHSSSFVISVEAIGLQSATHVISSTDIAAPLDFVLTRPPIVLPAIRVRAPHLETGVGRWTPGSSDRSRGSSEFRRRPMETDDAAALAEMSGGSESFTPSGGGISLTGQAPAQTHVMLDGASGNGTILPREAISSVAVVTNSYDVARGEFTGGNLDVRTQSAGNEWGGTLRLEGRHPWLQYGDTRPVLRNRSAYAAVDAGGGGAIIHDRLFSYAAITAHQSASPVRSIGNLVGADTHELGLHPDSLMSFLSLTDAWRPRSTSLNHNGSSIKSGLFRIDAALSQHHSFTLRLNGQVSETSNSGSWSSVGGTGTLIKDHAYGLLARLGSDGKYAVNDLRLHLTHAGRASSMEDSTATGIVRIALEDVIGDPAITNLRFAGSPPTPRNTNQRSFQLLDDFLITSPDRRHRFRLGGEFGNQAYTALPRTNYGSFNFTSLADLRQNRPAWFTRSFEFSPHTTAFTRAAFFAADERKLGASEFTIGLRAERSWYPQPRSMSSAVVSAFGTESNDVASAWRISPRMGFSVPLKMSWDRGVRGTTLQGGFGEFVGTLPVQLVSASRMETGSADVIDLVCTGPAAPSPDWARYRRDPTTIPTTCADGQQAFASRLPRATLFAPDFSPPRVWRASLSAGGAAGGALTWRIETSLLRGVSQPVAFDRNLHSDLGFSSPVEGGRHIYAPVGAIDPRTGGIAPGASRQFPELGIVQEITGAGHSEAVQVTGGVAKFFGLRGSAVFNYAYTLARETISPLTPPGGASGSVGGSPRGLEWAPSPYAPRHRLRAELTSRQTNSLSFSVVGRIASGLPFTPMTDGDVNGDGVSNDRAFIFELDAPGTREAEVGAGIRRLSNTAPRGVRHCLQSQAGRIAAPNSCWAGWTASLDLRAALEVGPALPASPYKRVTLWFIAQNIPSGLDYLLHGSDKLRNWGQFSAVDHSLLSVVGFDPISHSYRYDVNPGFGQPASRLGLNRIPFSFSIQARIAVGSDRAYQSFKDRIAVVSDGDAAMRPENLRFYFEGQLPNVPAQVLALNAPLHLFLSTSQATRLQQAADSLAGESTVLISELVDAVEAAGPTTGGLPWRRVTELSERATGWRRTAVEITESILTPDQWEHMPESLRIKDVRFSPTLPMRITVPRDW